MRDTNLLFVIEGIDGAGKSSVARRLCERLQAKYLSSVCAWARAIAPEFDVFANIGNVNTRLLFYLVSNCFVLKELRETLERSDIVMDRYFYSTIAYHRALGATLDLKLADIDFIEPNVKILLTVSEAVRKERLKNRGATKLDGLLEDRALRERVEGNFRQFELLEIDTSARTVDQVVDEIIAVSGRGQHSWVS